jgi:hypothetical protein
MFRNRAREEHKYTFLFAQVYFSLSSLLPKQYPFCAPQIRTGAELHFIIITVSLCSYSPTAPTSLAAHFLFFLASLRQLGYRLRQLATLKHLNKPRLRPLNALEGIAREVRPPERPTLKGVLGSPGLEPLVPLVGGSDQCTPVRPKPHYKGGFRSPSADASS